MSIKVLFLFQDSIQDPTLHLIVISPSFPLFCDYFVIFPCSWIWLFWKGTWSDVLEFPQVCIYLIFYQHFIGDTVFGENITEVECSSYQKVSDLSLFTYQICFFLIKCRDAASSLCMLSFLHLPLIYWEVLF